MNFSKILENFLKKASNIGFIRNYFRKPNVSLCNLNPNDSKVRQFGYNNFKEKVNEFTSNVNLFSYFLYNYFRIANSL